MITKGVVNSSRHSSLSQRHPFSIFRGRNTLQQITSKNINGNQLFHLGKPPQNSARTTTCVSITTSPSFPQGHHGHGLLVKTGRAVIAVSVVFAVVLVRSSSCSILAHIHRGRRGSKAPLPVPTYDTSFISIRR